MKDFQDPRNYGHWYLSFLTTHVVTTAQHVDKKHFQRIKNSVPQALETGTFSAEQYSGECLFQELSESEISADQTVECHHVGIPHEPMAFLEKTLQAVHPKDLRRHVDPTIASVVRCVGPVRVG